MPGADALRRELTDFFQDYGFALYGRAFSHFYSTKESIANLLNGQVTPVVGSHQVMRDGVRHVRANPWFQRLTDQGYRLRVYHSSFLNYCGEPAHAIEYCHVYPADTIRALDATDLHAGAKAWVVFASFLDRLLVFRIAEVLYGQHVKAPLARRAEPAPGRSWAKPDLAAIVSMDVFDRLRADVAEASRGTAYFAHLLLPHRSYVYDGDCRIRADLTAWSRGHDRIPGTPQHNTEASRAQAYVRHFDQVRCTHRKAARVVRCDG